MKQACRAVLQPRMQMRVAWPANAYVAVPSFSSRCCGYVSAGITQRQAHSDAPLLPHTPSKPTASDERHTKTHVELATKTIREEQDPQPQTSSSAAPALRFPFGMSLVKLDGEPRQIKLIHLELQELERGRRDVPTIDEIHSILRPVGVLETAASLRDNVRKYFEEARTGEAVRQAIAALDARLFNCGVLLEDLPLSVLEQFCKEPGTLAAPALAVDDETALRQKLYGKSRFPIPVPGAEPGILLDVPETAIRRQVVIERITTGAAVQEFMMQEADKLRRGVASTSSATIRLWTEWVVSMSNILEEKFDKSSIKRDSGASLAPAARTSAEPAEAAGAGQAEQAPAPVKTSKAQKDRGQDLVQGLDLEPTLLAVMTCQGILNKLLVPITRRKEQIPKEKPDSSITYTGAAMAVGEDIEAEWQNRQLGKGVAEQKVKFCKPNRKLNDWDDANVTVPIGGFLVDLLLHCAKFPVDKRSVKPEELDDLLEDSGPLTSSNTLIGSDNQKVMARAFKHHLVRESSTRTVGYVTLTNIARRHMQLSEDDVAAFLSPKHQPMLVPPRPWRPCGTRRTATGPFMLLEAPFVRTHNQSLTCLTHYVPDKVVHVMDSVGQTAWCINKDILKVMHDVYNKDLAIAEIPPQKDTEVPALPDNLHLLEPAEQKLIRLKRDNEMKRNQTLKSERPTFLLKLRVADDFENAPAMYFPHNVDFRGRAYPIPPHLNHIGDDVCRGLLQFAEPKPIGEHGLYWMKVHLCNLLGKNKIPFDERVKYVEDMQEIILKVADDPLALEVRDVWAKADDGPWQALATCMELAAIWRSEEPPEVFMSRIPIHLDGSCNGLQHYAALGRDVEGGQAVNLVPSDRPQDVYSVVLKIVMEKVMNDTRSTPKPKPEVLPEEPAEAEDGKKKKPPKLELDNHHMSNRLVEIGALQRKVVKQTVMTICYGVTNLGAKQQVLGQLQELAGDKIDPRELSLLATYLSRYILKSIDVVFERAMQIKKWFDLISKEFSGIEVPTMWISPIGLVCGQPYKQRKSVVVRTKRQSVTLREDEVMRVDKVKQRMGFPPNFIHSLDASHMMLVASKCRAEGLVFAGVHDSFWTHAGSIPKLQPIIRESFVELHGQPILENFRKDLEIRLGGVELPPLPAQGELQIRDVLDSKYVFH